MVRAVEHLVEADGPAAVLRGVSVVKREHTVASGQVVGIAMQVHPILDDDIETEAGHLLTH